MDDLRTLVRDEMTRAGSPSYSFNDLERRRDRKRRNQRIAAGVVGIAVFVAAIWIVMSGLSRDRSQTSVVPGGDVTGPAAESGPAVLGPPVAAGPATGDPHVVGIGSCSDGASSRLVLSLNQGVRIEAIFKIHRSPTGDAWRIRMRRDGTLFFVATKTANDSGDVEAHSPWVMRSYGTFRARAIDRSTGEVCWAHATI
jgi:hypothetical protein